MNRSEKRLKSRHRGKLAVELESGEGITRDFNNTGIFFETDRSFSPDQTITFTLVLEHIDPEHPVRLKCQGKIVRVEENGQTIGIASTIDSFTFKEFQKDSRR